MIMPGNLTIKTNVSIIDNRIDTTAKNTSETREYTLNFLRDVAKLAYGSGLTEGTDGGYGNVGFLNGHIIKFNTHYGDKIQYARRNDMIEQCNNLRLCFASAIKLLVSDEKSIFNLLKGLGFKADAIKEKLKTNQEFSVSDIKEVNCTNKGKEIRENLLNRKIVAKTLKKIENILNEKTLISNLTKADCQEYSSKGYRSFYDTAAIIANINHEGNDTIKQAFGKIEANDSYSRKQKTLLEEVLNERFSVEIKPKNWDLCISVADAIAKNAELKEKINEIKNPDNLRKISNSDYIEALNDLANTTESVLKSVSKQVTNGKTNAIGRDEVFLILRLASILMCNNENERIFEIISSETIRRETKLRDEPNCSGIFVIVLNALSSSVSKNDLI